MGLRSLFLSVLLSLCSFGTISAKEYKKIAIPFRKPSQKVIRMEVEKKLKDSTDESVYEGYYKREVKVRCMEIYRDGSALFDGTSKLVAQKFSLQDRETGKYYEELDDITEMSNILVESVFPTIHFQFFMKKNGVIIAQHLTQTMKDIKEIEKHPRFKELLKEIETKEGAKKTRQKKGEPQENEQDSVKKEAKKITPKEQLYKKFKELYEKLEEEDPYLLPRNIADEFLPFFRGKPKKAVEGKSFFLAKNSYIKWRVRQDKPSKTITLEGKGSPEPIILEDDRGILYQKEKRQVLLDANTGGLLNQKIILYTHVGSEQRRYEWDMKVLR